MLADGANKQEQKRLATAIKAASKLLPQTVGTVEPCQRQLRLFYSVAADKVAEREFEFSVIGPLPGFVIQAGGSIGVLAILAAARPYCPRFTDPNNPGSELPKGTWRAEMRLGLRHAFVL